MRKFKTESKKLLDLMINSIYTNREIFLRELISNASDAVDKLYFKSLTDSEVEISKDDLAILVSFDKDARTITVSDNGIGMDKDDLDRNLGTIAHSDSLEFKSENAETQGEDIDIIGQFGVGFYSAFMVASKVKVVSRAYGADAAYSWESDGVEGYTIKEAERASHGTDVILTLKEDTDEENYDSYLSEYKLKSLIKRYSNYVRYPVQMEVEKTRELPKPEDADDDYKPEFEHYRELDTINSMIPIWKRPKVRGHARGVQRSSTNPTSMISPIRFARSPCMRRARSPTMPCYSCRGACRSICTARITRRASLFTARTCSSWRNAKSSFPITSTSSAASWTARISRSTFHARRCPTTASCPPSPNASRRRSNPIWPTCAIPIARVTRSSSRTSGAASNTASIRATA